MRWCVGVVCLALVACSHARPAPVAAPPRHPTTTRSTTTTMPATTSTSPPTTTGPVTLAGCPPPPQPPHPPSTPWHPAVLVPETSLPVAGAPNPWASEVDAITGKGMWVWQWTSTEHGNADAVVARAVQSGLHQLWLRVADSKFGFYGKAELDAVVDKAHAAGLSVIALGLPVPVRPGPRRRMDGAGVGVAEPDQRAGRRLQRRPRTRAPKAWP